MKTLVVVVAILCPGENPWYSNKLNYSEQTCQQDGYGIALNLYLSTGKKREYKCVRPDWEPQEAK